MLKQGTHLKATEVEVLNTYQEGNNTLVLMQHNGLGYIGWETSSYFDADYELRKYEDGPRYEIIDDDATHLHLPEFEGIFEMRCDDFLMELRSLAASY